ncbi:MAG: hypothetical protein JO291_08255 [Acidimicrobiia bacterium]|nr:hypothetical protein [Acidimicrobiia bacterium]
MGKRVVVVVMVVIAALAAAGGRAEAAGGLGRTGTATIADEVGNYTPAVASDGAETLVVWEKRHGQNGVGDIYGRLTATDASESHIDTVRISLRAADEYLPDVAWNGSSFLVVWETGLASGHQEIHGRRVSKDGALLGSELAIAKATSTADRREPAVAAGPNGQFLVAWEDTRNEDTTGDDIYARRITSTGGLLDGTNLRVSFDSNAAPVLVQQEGVPDVAWNGHLYMVVYEAFNEVQQAGSILAAAFTSAGERVYENNPGPGGLGGTDNFTAHEPSITSGGGKFLLVYSYEDPAGGGRNIYASRFDENDSQPQPFFVSKASGDQTFPTVAFNGRFVAAWVDRRNGKAEIWGSRIGSDGTVQDPGGFLITNDFTQNGSPDLTKGSSKSETFTLAWEVNPDTETTGIQALGLAPSPK